MTHRVVFAGDYDIANKDGLRRTLRRLEAIEDLVLDLTDVNFIDSTFISELILLERTRKEKNFDPVTIVSPARSMVRRLFDVVGLTPIVSLVESYRSRDRSNFVDEYAVSGDNLDAAPERVRDVSSSGPCS